MKGVVKNGKSTLSTGARDELRLRVLRALEANPELSQRQLAAELGVSLGGVNYALKALIERGSVKADKCSEVRYQGGVFVRANTQEHCREELACDRVFGPKARGV